MKTKLTKYAFIVFAITFALTSCSNNEETIASAEINNIEAVETNLFSEEYPFTDTIRLAGPNSTFAYIVVSSDKEEMLQNHLKTTEYSLNLIDGFGDPSPVTLEDINIPDKNFDVDSLGECQKIRMEVISTSSNIGEYTINFHYKKSSEFSNNGMQKVVSVNWLYYEIISSVHARYMEARVYDNIPGDDYPVMYTWGYTNCWLCSYQTTGFYTADIYRQTFTIRNPWANDGELFYQDTDGKYKLAFGIYTHTRDNFVVLYDKYNPIQW